MGREVFPVERLAVFIFLTGAWCAAHAQQPCEFFSDQAREHLTEALQAAPTCQEAAALFDRCRWGSSVDARFGSIVMDKCDKELLPTLSAAGKANYQHELHLCTYEFEKQQGTIFISENTECGVRVAVDFASNPELANQPPARASFDCAKAQTSIEQAVCSDAKLGAAEIVLSRALHGAMSALKPEQKRAMTKQEDDWFSGAQKRCKVGTGELSAAARGCLRKEFESRFQALDQCSIGEKAACLGLTSAGPQP